MVARDSSTVVELEFRITDDQYPFVRVSDRETCQFELLQLLPRGEGRYAEFFSVTGADPEAVLERVQAPDVDSQLLARENSTGLFEFEVTRECPVVDLAAQEAIPQEVTSEDGTAHIHVEVVPPPDPEAVVDAFTDRHPGATLVEMVETDRSVPLFTRHEVAATLEERLTDRQLEVLRAAYEAGYYERPRATTGEEIAAELDISVATFSQHVRVAQEHVLSLLFENDLFSGAS